MGGKLEDVLLLAKTPEATTESLCHFSSKGPMVNRAKVILLKKMPQKKQLSLLSKLFHHAGSLTKKSGEEGGACEMLRGVGEKLRDVGNAQRRRPAGQKALPARPMRPFKKTFNPHHG